MVINQALQVQCWALECVCVMFVVFSSEFLFFFILVHVLVCDGMCVCVCVINPSFLS